MKEAPENPASNQLPPGINAKDMTEAVARSGYPLQVRVAAQLAPQFAVVEEWGYIDRDSQEPRSLDIRAYLSTVQNATSAYHPELILLTECKRSDLPFVFFAAAVPQLPRDYPALFGFRRERFELHKVGEGYREVSPAEFLCLRELPFLAQGPPVSRAFAKAERAGKSLDLSGEVPYRAVIMPLVSALHHWGGARKVDGDRDRYFPSLTLMVCVVDAPMLVATGRPEEPDLVMHPWVRVVRQESVQERAWVLYRHYVVDFVHAGYLDPFVSRHVVPFARQVTARIEEAKTAIANGRATVGNWDTWTWAELAGKL